MRSYSFSKGYTLIEVLIATLIFSAIVFLSSFALSQTLKQYQGLIERGLNFWEDSKILWLQRTLSSALDYYIYDERKNLWYPFFKGETDLIAYISLSPFSQDLPVLAVLKKEVSSSGKEFLLYYEVPVYTSNLKEIEDILVFEKYKENFNPIYFLKDVDSISFKYYGYDKLRKYQDWFPTYDSSSSFYLPSTIKISFKKDDTIDNLYIPINVQNLRKAFYNEFYRAS